MVQEVIEIEYSPPNSWSLHQTTGNRVGDVIIIGSQQWKRQNTAWQETITQGALDRTFFDFASGMESLAKSEFTVSNSRPGPIVGQKETRVIHFTDKNYGKKVIENLHKSKPVNTSAQVEEAYKELESYYQKARLEIDITIGTADELVYLFDAKIAGPNIEGSVRASFSYEAMIEIEPPP